MSKPSTSAVIENNQLVIRLPLGKREPSKSGKSITVASTRGNFKSEAEIDGQKVVIGVNAYIPLHK